MRYWINHKKYWQNRKVDWEKDYLFTANAPHRDLIVNVLRTFMWLSLWEIGIGGGANTYKILKEFPNSQLGGNDINQDAINFLTKTFKGAILEVGDCKDILLSDKATDVTLSDMTLIYINPFKIRRVLKELKRVTRTRVILVEFDTKSLWSKLKLRFGSAYWGHDYKKLLEKEGYYDIQKYKIPNQYYPDGDKNQFEYAYLITARP